MSKRKKKQYKSINGELYQSIHSPYDGTIIGWISAECDTKKIQPTNII